MIKRLIFDTAYFVGYRMTSNSLWDEKRSSFKVLRPSFKYWYADPVPFNINGDIYVFMEQYDRFSRIGYIAVSKYHNGKLGKPVTIIKKDTHLSFPMIICYGGEHFMIPETSGSKSIDIYRMGKDVYEWEKYYSYHTEDNVVDVNYLIKDNEILLIGSCEDTNPLNTKRVIYRLTNLLDRTRVDITEIYRDEVASPEVRNAGALMRCDDKLMRPVQCSIDKVYGHHLALLQVDSIDDTGILEKVVDTKYVSDISIPVNPLLNKKAAIHTCGCIDGVFETIDINCIRPSVLPIIRKLLL